MNNNESKKNMSLIYSVISKVNLGHIFIVRAIS